MGMTIDNESAMLGMSLQGYIYDARAKHNLEEDARLAALRAQTGAVYSMRYMFRMVDAIKDWAASLNIEYLASGSFGSVFVHPTRNDLVIKVGYTGGDGYRQYAMYCMMHPHRHLPMIYNIMVFEDFHFYTMEKLEYHSKHGQNQAEKTAIGRMAYNAWEKSTDGSFLNMVKALGTPDDLHAGNWMFRDDGTVVFTDIYCDAEKGDENYYTPSKHAINNRVTLEIANAARQVAVHCEDPSDGKADQDTALRDGQIVLSNARQEPVPNVLPPVRGSRQGSSRGEVPERNQGNVEVRRRPDNFIPFHGCSCIMCNNNRDNAIMGSRMVKPGRDFVRVMDPLRFQVQGGLRPLDPADIRNGVRYLDWVDIPLRAGQAEILGKAEG